MIIEITRYYVQCDFKGCDAEIQGYTWSGVVQAAHEAGWQVKSDFNAMITWCPKHRKEAGHD